MTDTKQYGPGEREGLSILYRCYASWLGRLVRTYVPAEDAEDVVQETYLKLARYRGDEVRHPKSLLLRIAMNVMRDERRRAVRRAAFEAGDVGMSAKEPVQFEAVALKQTVLSMPPLYRGVFVLSRFRGMTYPEIATKLDISVKTVEWRMSKALEYCATQLGA